MKPANRPSGRMCSASSVEQKFKPSKRTHTHLNSEHIRRLRFFSQNLPWGGTSRAPGPVCDRNPNNAGPTTKLALWIGGREHVRNNESTTSRVAIYLLNDTALKRQNRPPRLAITEALAGGNRKNTTRAIPRLKKKVRARGRRVVFALNVKGRCWQFDVQVIAGDHFIENHLKLHSNLTSYNCRASHASRLP